MTCSHMKYIKDILDTKDCDFNDIQNHYVLGNTVYRKMKHGETGHIGLEKKYSRESKCGLLVSKNKRIH